MSNSSPISQSLLDSAYSYEAYMNLMADMAENGKTTGPNQTDSLIEYSALNWKRMKRLNKTVKLSDEMLERLSKNQKDITFLVISESWCGDAAQNIPVIHKMAEACDCIDLRVILRDENLEIMDQFLTNGGRSIPKLIALDRASLSVLGTWGPRPAYAQQMVMDFKKIPNGDYTEFVKEVQLWYAKDKTISQQKELIECMEKWMA